jgi:hypothetical protein
MPTMIIWGRHDAIIPMGHGRLVHAAMPGSQFEVFDEAGHFPHHTDPARFSALVADFIATTAPAPYEPEVWRARLRKGKAAAKWEGVADPAAEDSGLRTVPLSPLPSAT